MCVLTSVGRQLVRSRSAPVTVTRCRWSDSVHRRPARCLAGWLSHCPRSERLINPACGSGENVLLVERRSDDGHRNERCHPVVPTGTSHTTTYLQLHTDEQKFVGTTVSSIPHRGNRTRHAAPIGSMGAADVHGRTGRSAGRGGNQTFGNHSAISRSADSTESEPCTRFCWPSRARSPRMVPGTAFSTGSVPPAI